MTPESGPAPNIGAVACTKVLIADDEPNIVVSLEFMMKREGFDVLVARDGRQALDAIRRAHPRLVLLDATMPGLSGFDVCEAVRADADVRSTLIVMLTAKGRETDMARGVGAGADAYVTKPFSTRDLVQQVKDMLAKDTAARDLAANSAAAIELPKDLPA
ncbi:response regulator transcription factor [Xanthobacter autotrophicus]|uniref:response regulator transcription factor n=1 Tax=Xanthobacter autotrophicus TaxID=280 RepID=UPI0024A72F42|nr:response regulator [Xanthobacter autotrophicus]MDI4657686.1 response regulator [Xanthobacter autotrophicus]